MTPEQERKVDELGVGVGEVNTQLADIRRKARRRTVILTLAIVLALIIGAGGGIYAYSVHRDLRTSQAATATARYSVCINFNEGQHHLIVQDFDQVEEVVRSFKNPSAAEVLALRDYQLRADARALMDNPDRPCTPEGIADYYAHPPKPTARPTIPKFIAP